MPRLAMEHSLTESYEETRDNKSEMIKLEVRPQTWPPQYTLRLAKTIFEISNGDSMYVRESNEEIES